MENLENHVDLREGRKLKNAIVTNNSSFKEIGTYTSLGFPVYRGQFSTEDDFFNTVKKVNPKYVFFENHLGGMPNDGEIFVNEMARRVREFNPKIKLICFSGEYTGDRLNPNPNYFDSIFPSFDFHGKEQFHRGVVKDFLYEDEKEGTPIDNLKLGLRSRNCLSKIGIKTIEELAEKSDKELLKEKNFGKQSLREIRKACGEYAMKNLTREEFVLMKFRAKYGGSIFGGASF